MPPSTHLAEPDERAIASALSWYRLPVAQGTARLVLVGELDLVTAARAREGIRQAQNELRSVICDLGDVWFIDLSGLRVLLDAAAHAKLTGREFAVTSCPPIVPRMLGALGLGHALAIHAG